MTRHNGKNLVEFLRHIEKASGSAATVRQFVLLTRQKKDKEQSMLKIIERVLK